MIDVHSFVKAPLLKNSVRIPPGSTRVVFILNGATSFASVSNNPSTAHFDAEYKPRPEFVI
jgi:hypothetical protein